jgi:hypothetical protein
MKIVIPLACSFLVSCASFPAEIVPCNLDKMDTSTVHIDTNHHIKLMPIPTEKVQMKKVSNYQDGWDDWDNWDDWQNWDPYCNEWWCWDDWYNPPTPPQPDPQPDPQPEPDPTPPPPPPPAPDKGEKDYSKGINPMQKDLGMAGVPVLDQGAYGTCVTFASTAALDALLQRGDYISQQCTLALLKGLGDDIWNGAYYPSQVIDPLKQHGIVSQAACPQRYGNPSQVLSVTAYKAYVSKEAAVGNVSIRYINSAKVEDAKRAIDAGHRFAIGFLLKGDSSEAVRGFDVLYQGQRYTGGLWACKQGASPNYCTTSNAGHEVVIIGYDEAQKLFKIRNSWNATMGVRGDYFMSYEFFAKMVIDGTEIW